MVKHLVMWNFKEDFPEEKKEAMAQEADARLKALVGQVKSLRHRRIWMPIRYTRCMWQWRKRSSSLRPVIVSALIMRYDWTHFFIEIFVNLHYDVIDE